MGSKENITTPKRESDTKMDVEVPQLKSNLKKKHDDNIAIKKLGDHTMKNLIPMTVMHTVVRDINSPDYLMAQEILDISVDNCFNKEEEIFEEQVTDTGETVIAGVDTNRDVDDQIGLPERFFAGMSIYMEEVHLVDINADVCLTKAEVLDFAIKLAAKLETLGVTSDDVICICSRTHWEQNIALLAAFLLGAIVAPINHENTLDEFMRLIGILKPRIIFCDPRPKGSVQIALTRLKLKCLVIVFCVDKPLYDGFERFVNDFEFNGFTITRIDNVRKKIAVILPTDGSSGVSKLCAISHYNIIVRCLSWKQKLLKGARKIMSWFPLSWFMQIMVTCTSYVLPITLIMQYKFTERSACKAIYDYQVDRVILGTVYALQLSKNVARIDFDMGCLRAIILGGATTTPTIISNIWKGFHYLRIFQCYGCTECGIVTLHCINDNAKMEKKAASSGIVMENGLIKIVDLHNKQSLGAYKIGLILVKSEGMMLNYYKDPERTKAAFEADGYFNTHDAGFYSNSGHLYIKGKDLDLLFANDQVYSVVDVDEFLAKHPNIEEMISVTNGKDIVCFIIKRHDKTVTETEIFFLLEKHNFPQYLIPKQIIFTDSFPRSGIGRVRKHYLRDVAFTHRRTSLH